ncbi:unnamed protein product [Polarella glacialis]|uniref:EF-hand domain-containing protein n=2 Tax=Polarella glacialis TaxID=89957 RepID=A0A813IFQ0_POLGL|nr:unnamed protein product [Polarella glacialis]
MTGVSLSPQGCVLLFGRIRRRLEAAGLGLSDALALFLAPGEKDLSAEQWLDAASSLPLGTSRAEMQQLFSKVDAECTGRVALALLEEGVSRASTAVCCTLPPWIAAAFTQRDVGGRIVRELQRRSADGMRLAPESAFRRVIMETERYLTSDQLNSLVLMADKNSSGLIDYEEFASRFISPGPLRVPGGVTAAPAIDVGNPSPEEIQAVGARVATVLEAHRMPAESLPALLALWGGDLDLQTEAGLLASLPLGMSRLEAEAQLQATGSVSAFAARVSELRSLGVWKSHCEWAAANIPGLALRSVLQSQVIEAESRTLEPADFMQALAAAGVAQANLQPAMWLTQKTGQGDVRVAEFLASFGGNTPAGIKQKKRGMLWRMMGR